MKSFIKTIVLYVLIVAAVIVAIDIPYSIKRVDTKTEQAKFQNVPDEIEICNLGSSHGVHSYYYEDLENDYTCFNFALDSQNFNYDNRILKQYQDCLLPGGVVIIDISFFAGLGLPKVYDNGFKSANKRYYSFLKPELIDGYDWYTDVVVRRLPVLNDGIDDIMTSLFLPKMAIENIKSYPIVEREIDASTLAEDVRLSSDRHIGANKRDESGEIVYSIVEINALYDIVSICRAHDVTPIFVTVPYTDAYIGAINELDDDFFERFYKWISNVSDELNVEYFDYSSDERFTHDYTLFYNGDHMNSAGARKFTNILYEEVLKNIL